MSHWLPMIDIDPNNGPGNYFDIVTEDFAQHWDLKIGSMVLAGYTEKTDWRTDAGMGFVGRVTEMHPPKDCSGVVVYVDPLTLLGLDDLGVFQTLQSPAQPPEPAPAGEDTTEADLASQRAAEGRCPRCGNWPAICGHHLTFAERMRSIGVDRSSLR